MKKEETNALRIVEGRFEGHKLDLAHSLHVEVASAMVAVPCTVD